jgi:hypothetical protein
VLSIHGPELWVGLAIDVAASVIGYVLSEGDRRRLGRTPWGLPSAVWAVIWLIYFPVGIILYVIAHRAEVRRAAQGPVPAADAYGRPAAGLQAERVTSEDYPAYPRPADGSVRPTPPPPPPPASAATPAGADMAPPSWQADPSGRFHYRWWTGSEWTSYVATDGHVVVDTSPDQRIGPY